MFVMRDEKEGRKKRARSNKQQSKATQHTQGAVTYMYMYIKVLFEPLPLPPPCLCAGVPSYGSPPKAGQEHGGPHTHLHGPVPGPLPWLPRSPTVQAPRAAGLGGLRHPEQHGRVDGDTRLVLVETLHQGQNGSMTV